MASMSCGDLICWVAGSWTRWIGGLQGSLWLADGAQDSGKGTVSRHAKHELGHVAAGPMLDALSMATVMRRIVE
jgi:hypothetical protein